MAKYLVKFMDSQFLPDFNNLDKYTIRLGTFLDFKETEDKKRQDTNEGQRGLDLILKKPCQQLDELILNNGYGDYTLDADGNFQAEYHLLVHDHLYEFNAWMFSCSFIDDLNEIEIIKEKFKCDSYYFISDVDKFINAIQSSLAQDIKENSYTLSGSPRINHKEGENIFIDGWKQPISYINETKSMNFTANTLTDFMNDKEHRIINQDLWFKKPERYKDEKEFRFILFGSGDRPEKTRYSVNDKFVLLDVDLRNAISNVPVNIE